MTAIIDYYFAPISGYAYLGHEALLKISRDTGAELRHHPMGCEPAFPTNTERLGFCLAEQRRKHRADEQRIWAERRNLPMRTEPAHWPTDPHLACRVILAARELGVDVGDVTATCLRGVWVEERNIADPSDLGEALLSNGLPGRALISMAYSEPIRDRAQAVHSAAIDAGVIGSPTYCVDGTWFRGQDQIDRLRAMLIRDAA